MRYSRARAALITVCAVGLAFAVRLALEPFIGGGSPFLLFAPAVMVAAFTAGPEAGVIATVLSALLGSHFLQGIGEPRVERWDRIALFLLVGLVFVVLSHVVRTARQRLTESLKREQDARERAEAANRVKDDFLAVVSHELQTPASVILGWATMIRARRLNDDALDHAIDAIERNARLQSRLVQDVLETSRIASGTMRLDMQPTSLTDVLQAAVDQARPGVEAAGIRLMVHRPGKEVAMVADPVRLQQVFANLLSNAVKFTPAGGVITALLTTTRDRAVVTIADTGVGISAEFLPRLFQRFTQDPRTLSQSRRGLGLGLSIAHNLVERHGGTIQAASDGPGRGTTFTITLPVAPSAHAGAAPESSERSASDAAPPPVVH